MATDVTAGSQTLDRALSALIRIGESGPRGLTLAECSASLGYSKPTTHRILRTLDARGFLRVDPERGLYTLGPTNLRLGMSFLEHLDIRTEALPVLRELGERTGETVHLGVLDGSDVIYIEKIESTHAVRMFSSIGHTMPAYSTGIGKAILAHLGPDELEQALPEKLEQREHRRRSPCARALLRHLADIRGAATRRTTSRTRTVFAASARLSSTTRAGRAPGSALPAPSSRSPADRFQELGELVREAAMSVSAADRLRPRGRPCRGGLMRTPRGGRPGARRRLQREVVGAPARALPSGRPFLGSVSPRRCRRPRRDRRACSPRLFESFPNERMSIVTLAADETHAVAEFRSTGTAAQRAAVRARIHGGLRGEATGKSCPAASTSTRRKFRLRPERRRRRRRASGTPLSLQGTERTKGAT